MSAETNVGTLDYIEASGQALHAAQELATKIAAEQTEIAAVVPQRAEFLIQLGLVPAAEKQAACEQLSDHRGALDIVGNLAKMFVEARQKQAAADGGGRAVDGPETGEVRVKSADAGADLSHGGYVGRRAGAGEHRESDLALMRGLGISR